MTDISILAGFAYITDLGINNGDDEALTFEFHFPPRGTANTAVAFSNEFTLQPNTNANIVDIWKLFTGGDGTGSINVCVNNPDAADAVFTDLRLDRNNGTGDPTTIWPF